MTKHSVYIASDFRNKDFCRTVLRPAFEAQGIKVISRWHFEEPALDSILTDAQRATVADVDLDDVHAARGFVLYNPPSMHRSGSGGRHVETGVALAIGKPIFIIGERENVFNFLPDVLGCWPLDHNECFTHEGVKNVDGLVKSIKKAVDQIKALMTEEDKK